MERMRLYITANKKVITVVKVVVGRVRLEVLTG